MRKIKNSTVPKNNTKPALVPKLRFPEFWGTIGWTDKPLKDVAQINPPNIGLPESFIYIDLESVDGGKLNSKTRISRVGAPSRAQRLIKHGDIIYQVVRPYQRNNLLCVFEDDEDYVASSGYAQLRAKGSNRFLYQSIHTDSFVGKVMAKCTGSNYPAINSSDFAEIELSLPPTSAEQHKIADCLSSVDELIAAQVRKVDALKIHKKGLMQQLFPREGESRPCLRFSEFQAAGEWKILPLAALTEKIMVGIASAATHAYRENGVPMLRNQNIKEGKIDDSSLLFIDPVYEVAHKRKRLKEGDVITVRTGYPGLSAVVTERYHNAQCFTTLISRPKKTVLNADYLCAYINSEIGKRFILGAEAGGAQKNVNVGALEELSVYFPKLEEQKRIATCLNCFDTLIAAELQRLDTLKRHKRGLMQQLFPLPEKNEA